MIQTARADKILLCVSEDDLLAPYNERPRRRQAELCAVLENTYDIPLRFEDFLSSFADQDGAVQSVTPIQVVSLQPGERMLVVTCSYAFSEADRAGDPDERFAIAKDSVCFNLIAALPHPAGPTP